MAQSPEASLLPDNTSLSAQRHFRCFNTDVAIELSDWRWSHLLPTVETFLHRFEAQFSRFLPDNELSRFNQRVTATVAVSDEMLRLLSVCVEMHHYTDGIFNPLVLQSLEAAGYDRSFERLDSDEVTTGDLPDSLPSLTELRLHPARKEASLAVGLRLDFGGIGKGYAVDEAAALLAEASGCLVDAGGDIYAAGVAPGGGAWRVDVMDPASPDERLDVVAISDAAIATSWTTRRRWKTAKGWRHHLIDPRTGLPADTGVIGATVVATRALEADVLAKCALILGHEEGVDFLERRGAEGLLVLEDGTLKKTRNWPSA
jgi:FAD:protein FMN transferase